MNATTIAIDLTKDVFVLASPMSIGRIIERKLLSRSAFSRCLATRLAHGARSTPVAAWLRRKLGPQARAVTGSIPILALEVAERRDHNRTAGHWRTSSHDNCGR